MTGLDPGAAKRLLAELERVKGDPKRFKGYRDHPAEFARDVLGIGVFEVDGRGLWAKQVAILESIRDHRLTTVRSGHGIGKTYTFAVAALWWLYARQGLVVTTASSWPQVRDVLWRQIHMLGAEAKVHLPRLDGHPLQTEWAVTETWRAWGRSVDNPTSWQGIHHPDLLVLVDEAVGIKADIHRSLRSLATGGNNRFCYIANPTEYGGPFWESHQEGSGFNRIHVSCLDHPNIVHQKELIPGAVTQAWIDEQARESGEESPEYAARVLGEFPAEGTSAVFSQKVVDRAMEEEAYQKAREAVLEDPKVPIVFSLDVARYGSNKTVLVERHGDVIVNIEHWQGHDAVTTQDRVKALVTAARDSGKQVAALVVDEVGLGGPIMDNLRKEIPWLDVLGFHSGRPAKDGVYNNRRSELWLRARRVYFDSNRVRLPYHKQLRIDLLSPTYGFNSSSKLQVERKEQLERRGVDSSDFADAVLMSLVTDFRYDEPEAPPVGANRDPLAMEKLEPLEESQSPFEALPGWA